MKLQIFEHRNNCHQEEEKKRERKEKKERKGTERRKKREKKRKGRDKKINGDSGDPQALPWLLLLLPLTQRHELKKFEFYHQFSTLTFMIFPFLLDPTRF
jgi:hypothetical protein